MIRGIRARAGWQSWSSGLERGTRMTVQRRLSARLWLITHGEALVSADARPLRVAGYGDGVGLAALLRGGGAGRGTGRLSRARRPHSGPRTADRGCSR